MSAIKTTRAKRTTVSRRRFMRGAVATGLGLPFLPSLMSKEARAEGAPPKRFLALVTQQGERESGFISSGSERGFTLAPVLEPLQPYQDRVLALHNLKGFQHGHGVGTAAALCAGWNPGSEIYMNGNRVPTPQAYHDHYHMGPSIDQVIADRIGASTVLPSLQAGVKTLHGGFVSYAGPELPVPPIQQPRALFDRIASGAFGDPDELRRLRAQELWVVDAVAQNFEGVQSRLSASERRVVDAHLTMLHEHEARLNMQPIASAQCEPHTAQDIDPGEGFDVHTRAQFENVITALRCDVTRVVTVAWGKGESNYSFPWLGINESWHDPIAHGNGPSNHIDLHNTIKRWHFEEVAELCRRLDEIPDGDGTTLLDNTLILVADELQVVNASQMADSHARRRMPAVLIGDAQGFFDTGRYLDMDRRPYGDLLFTVGHAMGLTDLTTFGSRQGPADNAPPPAALLDQLRA